MKFTTLIPTARNDGRSVEKAELETIFESFRSAFGGCSIDGPVRGHWVDETNGVQYADECFRLEVVCDNSRLAEAEAAVIAIGRQLDQATIYFEVRDFDGVRFLRIK